MYRCLYGSEEVGPLTLMNIISSFSSVFFRTSLSNRDTFESCLKCASHFLCVAFVLAQPYLVFPYHRLLDL